MWKKERKTKTHQNGWWKRFASTKSIRTEGQWVIHLLVQHNYLFFFPSFTSLFIWDTDVPANQKNALFFVIIQIKHRFLGENVDRRQCAAANVLQKQTPLKPNEGILLDVSLHTRAAHYVVFFIVIAISTCVINISQKTAIPHLGSFELDERISVQNCTLKRSICSIKMLEIILFNSFLI